MPKEDDPDSGEDVSFDDATLEVTALSGQPLKPASFVPAPVSAMEQVDKIEPLPKPKTPDHEVSGPVYRFPFQFGRYTLLKRLGVGGMAEAFLAQQDGPSGFKKQTVVKRILPHLAEDARFVQMFQREAKVAALLTHTNVVQIYELSEIGGVHFIAMEYVDGVALNKLARTAWGHGRSVPLEVISCAIADAALGLAAAHELVDAFGKPLGVVHRDISPDNLMMNREGVTKILDFGVAKLAAGGGERTAAGDVKGKIPFLAPEYITGHVLDARADIYALGVTFYWLVTGKRPFHAPGDLMLMEAIVKEAPVPPMELNAQVPPFINDLILQLLEKDPAKRPQTGFELHDALSEALGSRRSIVVPFVRELLAGDLAPDAEAAHTPGFVPSTPHTESLRSAWQRRGSSGGAAVPMLLGIPPGPTLTVPPSSPLLPSLPTGSFLPLATTVGDTAATLESELVALQPSSPSRWVAFVIAGAVVLGAVFFAYSFLHHDAPPEVVAVAPAPTPTTTTAPAVDPPAKIDAAAKVDAPADTPSEKVAAAVPTEKPASVEKPAPDKVAAVADKHVHERAAVVLVDVEAKAPAGIQWQTSDGKALGSGTGTLKIASGTRQVVAVDKKRGGRLNVTINGGVADYGALAHGKIHPRVKPFADVFLGTEALGTTPFAPVDVVVGKYSLRFVHNGKEEKRTVDVAAGETARVVVDLGD